MRSFGALLVVLLLTIPAVAQECLLRDAIYVQPATGYGLDFSPVDFERHPMNASNAFAMVLPGSTTRFDGVVTHPNGVDLPDGSVSLGCPVEGSNDQCSVWQGVVYAMGNDGMMLLPREDQPAPRQVLLPAFSRSLNYSLAFHDLHLGILAEDIFTLEGCAL